MGAHDRRPSCRSRPSQRRRSCALVKKSRECAFCGSTTALTRDHLPPKSFFRRPRPANLITVPCCEACRARTGNDDEYFRFALAMRPDAASHPVLRSLVPTIWRALDKIKKQPFARFFTGLTFVQFVSTPAGLYVPAVTGSHTNRRSDFSPGLRGACSTITVKCGSRGTIACM